MNFAVGSAAYAAPEMIKGQLYTEASDIWSTGILLLEVIESRLPYYDDNIQIFIKNCLLCY
jgi:serine/threonine protein kinase